MHFIIYLHVSGAPLHVGVRARGKGYLAGVHRHTRKDALHCRNQHLPLAQRALRTAPRSAVSSRAVEATSSMSGMVLRAETAQL